MKYIVRWMEDKIAETLKANPVVVLTGPRQVGKSTLLEQAGFLRSWRYLTLDDPDVLEQAQEDPKGLLLEDIPTIIDEAQRCPELLLTVKYLVDKTKRKRNFILSGSGNVSLRQSPRETLAGRVNYLHLTGFSMRELRGLSPYGILNQVWENKEVKSIEVKTQVEMAQVVWRGSLPGVVLASSDTIALERGRSYIDTYISRDIQDLVKIRYPQNFRRLMEVLAQATGWESVQEELSKSCGETRTNVSRYMSLLQDTNLLHEVRGYVYQGERSYKQSKFYWFDSGAACLLAGITSGSALKKPNIRGRYFENFIFQQIYSWASLQTIMPEILYWKPRSGSVEVDFVIRSAGKAIGVEVKSSDTVDFRDTKSMREFLSTHPEVTKGIIVYSGCRVYTVATNIHAVPWTML
ncbi:MAG: ATP-binding protein [Candidatus Omnitrophica bacterium]|nr:ATP-binding protein [Candidatus Omnitrophota bacterium]